MIKKAKKITNPHTSGIIRMHHRGFGFVQSRERERYPEDIFIPKAYVNGSIDGDEVEVEVNTTTPSEKGLDGVVVAILKRGRTHVAGTILETFAKGGYAYVPLLGPTHRVRVLSTKEHSLNKGDRLIIKISEWGTEKKESVGSVAKYLGSIKDPKIDNTAAIAEYELPSQFPEEVIAEAKQWGDKVTSSDTKSREDLRHLECFTIDPKTAKDFDDALSLTCDEKGHYHLGVHIADVSHYVRPGTALDTEARKRCNSTYLPGFVIPMLPHELSSELCSLKANVNRLTASVLIELNPDGTLIDYKMVRAVIKSQKRFTYEEAKEVLDGKKKSPHKPTLELMAKLCYLLKKKRAERGSIEFSLPGLSLAIDESGIPSGIEIVEYDITHQLVEEFMLKANELIATHLAKTGKPLAYRIHDEPAPDNIRDFVALATAFGFRLSQEPTAEQLQSLFDEARSSPFGAFLATAFIRSMKLASYSVQNIGHYGLGLEYYTHFTSPIRRYIDLMVHRALFDEVDAKEDLAKIALACSEQERLSAKAEQSVTQLKKLRLLEKYHLEEPMRHFKAIITHVKPFGIVFEVVDLMLEGFLPISEIDDDYLIFDEKQRRLVGKYRGVVYGSGDTIEVLLQSYNLITGESRWMVVPKKGAPSKKGGHGKFHAKKAQKKRRKKR